MVSLDPRRVWSWALDEGLEVFDLCVLIHEMRLRHRVPFLGEKNQKRNDNATVSLKFPQNTPKFKNLLCRQHCLESHQICAISKLSLLSAKTAMFISRLIAQKSSLKLYDVKFKNRAKTPEYFLTSNEIWEL